MKSLLLLLLFGLFSLIHSEYQKLDNQNISVHLLPHSHWDVGWLKTIDEYYEYDVTYVITNIIQNNEKDKNLRFVFSEITYIQMWFEDKKITDELKDNFIKQLKNKQIEFVLGGRTMPDEACNTYSSIITTLTSGHKYIKKRFTEEFYPKIGWSIDPFGASSAVNRIHKLTGFNATVHQRIPYNEKQERISKNQLEFWWKQNQNVGTEYEFLTHIMSENYCEYRFFNIDHWGYGPTTKENLEHRVNKMIDSINERSKGYSTNDFLLPIGCDFTFAEQRDMDMLNSMAPVIEEIKRYYGIDIKFSLLSEYFSKLSISKELTYQSDFNPYSDNPNDYWSGFYTSYPVLKRRIRSAEAYFRNSNFLLSTVFLKDDRDSFNYNENIELLNYLEKSLSDTTHHDAITGTSKKRINDDCYFPILDQGISNGKKIIKNSLEFLTKTTLSFNVKEELKSLKDSEMVELVFYNSLSWNRSDYLTLYLSNPSICLFDSNDQKIPSQSNIDLFPDEPLVDEFELHFQIDIPAMGFTKVFAKKCQQELYKFKNESNPFNVGNPYFDYFFSTDHLIYMHDKVKNRSVPLSQEFFRYETMGSGKYIFAPTKQHFNIKNPKIGVENFILRGPLITMIHQRFDYYCEQIIKIFHNKKYSEFNMKVGHPFGIPTDSEIGTMFAHNNIQNNKYYHDANGLEVHERESKRKTNKIQASYYPLVYSAFVKDDEYDEQVTVMSSHTHGVGPSFRNGSLEIMLKRRSSMDDGRGVGESMFDLSISKSKFRLLVADIEQSVEQRHTLSYELNYPPNILATKPIPKSNLKLPESISKAFPKNLHLLSFDLINNMTFIVRLQNLYQKNEEKQPTFISLSRVFKNFTIYPLKETTVSLMHKLSDVNVTQEILLKPMEIRTFVLSKYNITETDQPLPSPKPSPNPNPIPPSSPRNDTLIFPNFTPQFLFSFGLLSVTIVVVILLIIMLIFSYTKKKFFSHNTNT
eukprot:gene39-4290_t